MKKNIVLLLSFILTISLSPSCKDKKETSMVDMDTIKTDGSRDDKYIFRKEIEKQESREKKYKKNRFE